MSISVNIHGNAVKNRGRLIERLYAIQPRAVFVLDNLELALSLKEKLPNTTVVFREFEHNRAVHKDHDPMQWLDAHAHQAAGGVTLNVLNEPPFDQDVIDWLVKVAIRAVEKKVRVCLGNFAVGNPTGDPAKEWPKAQRLLEIVSANPEYLSIGLHEYFAGVPTSGLIGGVPEMIRPGEWPAIVPFTRWHCGRFQFLIDFCNSINLKPPRILVTEAGADNLSDIGEWLKGLKRIAPDKDPRSWRTLAAQWRIWYPSWSTERAYFEMLKWLDQTIYKGSPVEAQMIFCYGHSSDQWADFDVEDANEFWDLLIAYTKEVNTVPVLPLPNDARWSETTNASGSGWRVRLTDALTDGNELGWVQAGEKFSTIDRPGSEWIFGKNASGVIGYINRGVLSVATPAPPPAPPEFPPDSEEHEPPTEPSEEELLLIELRRAYTSAGEAFNKLAIASARYAEYLKSKESQIRESRLANAA